jgi:6-phosphofructokinase 1
LTNRFITLGKNDTVIVVAEGAGQDLLDSLAATDPSGNKRFNDIGIEVKNFVDRHMKSLNVPYTIKYIDPSYTIRCAEANTSDALYCIHLAQMACHAAMSGRTELVVSQLHGNFVHIPMLKAVESRKELDVNGWLYNTLLDATGQPQVLNNPDANFTH